jgi:3-phenylpropionate/trans-cinnamate dioxygenase ferredoxin reductase subunit
VRGAGRVAVIGGGWIGSEVAASARQRGADVVMIDPTPTPLHGVLGAEVGASFAQLHRDHGVALRMGTGVASLTGSGRVEGVVLTDGSTEAADVVVVGVGAVPNTELAQAAGLAVDNGIVVDERLRTGVPGVLAAGDVASAYHPHYDRHVRVEHWANALNQGAAAGRNAVGDPQVYDRLPYFYSDQYDLGMEYVGLAGGRPPAPPPAGRGGGGGGGGGVAPPPPPRPPRPSMAAGPSIRASRPAAISASIATRSSSIARSR